MRYDTEHKQRTREKVLAVAARAIRDKGPDGVGVAEVMAEAGLTHGGFYAHFRSKDDLIAAAIGQMFDEGQARLHRETDGRSPREGLRAYATFYLSTAHRDARKSGCPVAALGSDIPRLGAKTRRSFSAGMQRLTDGVAALLAAMGAREPGLAARSLLAEMVGALMLSRLEADAPTADAILEASRRAVFTRIDALAA